jgi:predicted Zn-dependent peptidase
MEREKILEGVYFNAIYDDRFKTNRISVNLILPLDDKTATSNAIVPFLLRKSYKECPDFTMLNKKLSEMYGAFLDADVRKIGDSQLLTISISSIDDRYSLNNEKLVSQMSDLLCKILLTPDFVNGEFKSLDLELEKQFLIDTIESQINDKRVFAIKRLEEIMFANEPSGVNKYGDIKKAKELDTKQATLSYEKIISTARIEVIFVGSGDFDLSKQIFKQAFNSLKRENIYVPETIFISDVEKIKEVTEEMQISQAKMVLGFRAGVKPTDKDVDALRVMVALYGGTPFSRLFVNVREKLSLCYYCAARHDRTKGIITVDCGVEENNIESAKSEILNQLEIIKKGEFEKSELESAKLSLIDSMKSVTDSPSSVEVWYLGQILFGTNNSPQIEAKQIEKITFDEVVKVAQKIKLDTVYILKSI